MKKNECNPPGTQTPCSYLLFCTFLSSSWSYGKVPMWRGVGAQQLQYKSESAQCPEKQQSRCEGDEGGGLKI